MKLLVVIPMRGNSKGIPRKNLRLMNGIPLMIYSINNAKSLKNTYDVDVVIDTEDLEIAEIAEQNKVETIMRPVELTGDDITLDPVIFHALTESEKRHNVQYDIVMTMQATSPTLKKETVKDALKSFIDSEYDTLISAVNDAHLSWGYNKGKYFPQYRERVNRQYLPKSLKETGGFLITRRNCVSEKTRIGEKITVYEVSRKESIDIDNEYDWKVCEAILKSKKIILRADGEEELGMGHIYRCLSLAYHLTGHDILFVTKESYKLGINKLNESYFPIRIIKENNNIFDIVDKFHPDIVVNDILNTDSEYMKLLKQKVPRIINFEDRGEGAKYADCVINALFIDKCSDNVYNGFEYFFIRDEFLTAVPKTFSEKVRNIVILFGGSDPSDLTRKSYGVFQKISENFPEISFHIITGFGYRYKDEVKTDEEHHIYVHNDVKRVSKYLAEADLAVTSQGRTMYELACMGVPSVVLAQNSREMEHMFANISNGFISLGMGKQQDDKTIQATIEWLINTPYVRKQMNELLLGKNFTKGQERVIKLILGENNEDTF